MNDKLLKDIFCANCQIVTSHQGSVEPSGDFVFTCLNQIPGDEEGKTVPCGRFLKIPADVEPQKFAELLVAHEDGNKGQISMQKQEEKLLDLLGVTLKGVEPVTEQPEAPAEPAAPAE